MLRMLKRQLLIIQELHKYDVQLHKLRSQIHKHCIIMFPIHIGATAPSSCTRRAIMEKAAGAPGGGGDAERAARLCVCVCV